MNGDGFVLHFWKHRSPAAHSEQGEEAKNIQQPDKITHGLGWVFGRQRMMATGATSNKTVGRET